MARVGPRDVYGGVTMGFGPRWAKLLTSADRRGEKDARAMNENASMPTPDAASNVDSHMDALSKRAAGLQDCGLSSRVAFGMAEFEARISRWPKAWGTIFKD
jgi:hypothetical protein